MPIGKNAANVGHSPTTEQCHWFMQSLSSLRETVFGFGRYNGVYLPFNEPAALERAKHLNQHLLRDVGNLTLHFVESPDAAGKGMRRASAIADTYWHLAHQEPSAWTLEIDVRPFKEKF